MKRYNPKEIEAKWQQIWADTKAYEVREDPDRAKIYVAEMFPYPSGAGLHVGHVRNFSIVDCLGRYYRQQGYNVLRPIGWDTFGLPAENYAIKTGISPQSATKTNIANFKKQYQRLGMAVDWSREINTSNPEYYRWTQWIFARLFERGLAYQKESFQWWCPFDKTVLANEQVESGKCWRCGNEVEKKKMKQWFFRITAYADELLDDIDGLDWPEKIKTMQRNWIGRSVGAEVQFGVSGVDGQTITVFTTRPDTIFGATFIVLAPEHPLVGELANDQTREAVEAYCEAAMVKTEIERQENKDKTGVFTGSYAVNPATGENIPIWVADYVVASYGEGAIMAVPAHDERDREFAEQFDLPIVEVVQRPDSAKTDPKQPQTGVWTGDGVAINSGEFTGLQSKEAKKRILAWLAEQGVGQKKTTYRMHDWLISRQRYWGAPIPVAYDAAGQPHLIPDDQLPVLLPEITDYQPDDSGRSALAKDKKWLKVTIDRQEMTRETDTMDGYACSSWYLLRYCDPRNTNLAWDAAKVDYWNPVDFYVGGDHAVAHLLYVRFWTKFFADEGLLGFREPVKRLLYNGYINAPDGKKMSKSKGNVIDPLEIIDQGYGADALRTYELFIGPYDLDAAWDPRAIGGVYRFLNRAWTLVQEYLASEDKESRRRANGLIGAQHAAVKRVTEDLNRNSFNTAIAALMEYVNELYKLKLDGFDAHWREALGVLAQLVAPFAPHIGAELFEQLGNDKTLEEAGWPEWDEKYLVSSEAEVVVQVNGKLRGKFTVAADKLGDEAEITRLALAQPTVQAHTDGKQILKTIYIEKNRLLSVVVKN